MVFHRIYDFTVELLEKSDLTFHFKDPWFAGMDTLVTVDPANIDYILSSNFWNYTKGPEFKEVFDVFKDVIFNADSELWKNLRKGCSSQAQPSRFSKIFSESHEK